MSKGHGEVQKKIILLLMAGLALGLSSSPKTSFKIIRDIGKEWKDIEKRALKRAIKGLYESKLVKEKENSDGTITLILTEKGKEKALTYNLDEMEIKKPKQWDKKWRIVLFDIPEHARKIRDAFRCHLKNLNFYEFQKSVFIHPYDCKNEIDYLVEFYNARKFIRFIIAEHLDNELHLKTHFKLE
ncbi:MAG: hypothetical protein AAB491_02955 [Patescibacteria group bacterium]